jgi:hypothetical protein
MVKPRATFKKLKRRQSGASRRKAKTAKTAKKRGGSLYTKLFDPKKHAEQKEAKAAAAAVAEAERRAAENQREANIKIKMELNDKVEEERLNRTPGYQRTPEQKALLSKLKELLGYKYKLILDRAGSDFYNNKVQPEELLEKGISLSLDKEMVYVQHNSAPGVKIQIYEHIEPSGFYHM